jgi:hypothetical protein
MSPDDFIAEWQGVTLIGRASVQAHLAVLACRSSGHSHRHHWAHRVERSDLRG